jgi:hypothetical protein
MVPLEGMFTMDIMMSDEHIFSAPLCGRAVSYGFERQVVTLNRNVMS